MTIYYGEINGIYGFYDDTLGIIPLNSIPLSNEEHINLLNSQSLGAKIIMDNGPKAVFSKKNNINRDKNEKIILKELSNKALTNARTYVYNNYSILNEPIPEDWVTYIKALMAISNGTDTTSTTLPMKPS